MDRKPGILMPAATVQRVGLCVSALWAAIWIGGCIVSEEDGESTCPPNTEKTTENPADTVMHTDTVRQVETMHIVDTVERIDTVRLVDTGVKTDMVPVYADPGAALEFILPIPPKECLPVIFVNKYDPLGYVRISSDQTCAVRYRWLDIAKKGTRARFYGLEREGYDSVTLEFDFPFYGRRHRKVYINPNGFLSLNPRCVRQKYTWVNHALPSKHEWAAPAMIAPYHEDLDKFRDTVRYRQDTDKLVVTWENMYVSHLGYGPLTFQAILSKTGRIRFNYRKMNTEHTTPTIGIQNHSRDAGMTIFFDDGTGHRYNPVHDSLSIVLLRAGQFNQL